MLCQKSENEHCDLKTGKTARATVKSLFISAVALLAVTLFCYGNAFCADTFTDSMKNGKLSGEVKIWFQTNDNDAAGNDIFEKENSVFDAGLRLSYVTDAYKGLSFGASFYAIDDLSAFDTFANKSLHRPDHHDTLT